KLEKEDICDYPYLPPLQSGAEMLPADSLLIQAFQYSSKLEEEPSYIIIFSATQRSGHHLRVKILHKNIFLQL
ncbi:MAG: hypothetical protein QW291_09680, partial [Thermofilaceae archaeon]